MQHKSLSLRFLPAAIILMVVGLFGLSSCGTSEPIEEENSLQQCQDGVDNDVNGLSDCRDPSCSQWDACIPDAGAAPLRYPHGIQPTTVREAILQRRYAEWLQMYYEEDPAGSGMARVRFDNRANTVSEGIAYGMLITVALDSTSERFDKLWAYYRNFTNQNGLMHWTIAGFDSVVSRNAATDAELDAAVALIIADRRWGTDRNGETYRHWAEDLIAKIKAHEVNPSNNLLKPGDVWFRPVNPSYISGVALRLFASFTGDQDWITITQANYELLARSQIAGNGLYPDWCMEDGGQSTTNPDRFGFDLSYDAIRTFWRIGWDYLWFGAPEAAALNQVTLDWIVRQVGNNARGIYTEYTRSGNGIGQPGGALGIGSFCFVATHSPAHQSWLNSCYTAFENTPAMSYFSLSLQVIYMSIMTGKLERPDL